MRRPILLSLFIALTVFATVGHAKHYAGDGAILKSGVRVNASSARQFTAVVVRYTGNGEPTTTEGGSHRTGEAAAKEADRMARKMAAKERKQLKKDVRQLNREGKENLWQRLKNLFKKNPDSKSVMLGPDGQGDERSGGSMPDPHGGGDIHILF